MQNNFFLIDQFLQNEIFFIQNQEHIPILPNPPYYPQPEIYPEDGHIYPGTPQSTLPHYNPTSAPTYTANPPPLVDNPNVPNYSQTTEFYPGRVTILNNSVTSYGLPNPIFSVDKQVWQSPFQMFSIVRILNSTLHHIHAAVKNISSVKIIASTVTNAERAFTGTMFSINAIFQLEHSASLDLLPKGKVYISTTSST